MKLKKRAWPTIVIASVAAVGAIAASAAPLHREDTRSSEPRLCCVANPRFAGVCSVALGPDEGCQDVLAYLNNAASVGKAYCGNTSVRMGWKQVDCEE
jgi:hypothetical protein